MAKKRILVLADWYLPAYKAGGPVKSVAALVYHLRADYDFYIITSDKDAFETQSLPVETKTWTIGKYGEKVLYLPGKISKGDLLEAANGIEYDVVYINSFFSKPFSIYPLLLQKQGKINKPVVLAPRGMLRTGALAIKPAKKKIFLALSKLGGLHKNITWHATSEQEVNEIRNIYGANAEVVLAANLTLPPAHKRTNYEKKSGELKVCSVTRLVRNKKIDLAIEILKEIKEGKISYDIYGPAEDKAYYEECLVLTKDLRSELTITFHGNIEPQEVEGKLQEHHVFLLPTETENFGHAIIEAMLNGCIPVISDQTPWQNLEEKGVGWDLALDDKKGFVAAIKMCLLQGEDEFKSQSIKIQEFARAKTTDFSTVKAYEQLFK